MAAYVDYTYYSGTSYAGTAIASADFARLALKASAIIDRITFGRVAAIITANTDTDTIDLIKKATCAVAEKLQDFERGAEAGIQSESIGSNSVTYSKGSEQLKSRNGQLISVASDYLEITGLMYPGFLTDEYGGVVLDAD